MSKLFLLFCASQAFIPIPHKLGNEIIGPISSSSTFIAPFIWQALAIPPSVLIGGLILHMAGTLLVNLSYLDDSQIMSKTGQAGLFWGIPSVITCLGLYLPVIMNFVYFGYHFLIAAGCLGMGVSNIVPKLNLKGRIFCIVQGLMSMLCLFALPVIFLELNKVLIAGIWMYYNIVCFSFLVVSAALNPKLEEKGLSKSQPAV